MKLVVLSPPDHPPQELAVLELLLAEGLERYHVRKPGWSCDQLDSWLAALPSAWRPRIVLHRRNDLVQRHGLGGGHWPDEAATPLQPPVSLPWASRSCHDLAGLEQALGRWNAVLLSPIFPSISKPGWGPHSEEDVESLGERLRRRTPEERATEVLALGGISAERIDRVRELGFDGVAVLGAVWQAPDPVAAYRELQSSLLCHAG